MSRKSEGRSGSGAAGGPGAVDGVTERSPIGDATQTASPRDATLPLAGSIALVTGASRGIGAAAAVALARLGAHPVLVARTQGGLEETDDAIRALGGSATLLPFDLREGEAVDAIGPSIYQRFGRLDILVHAAGVLGRLTPAGHILPEDWDEVMGVNRTAAWRLIRTFDPVLRQAPSGRAVFVTDARAREPRAYWGNYGTSKAAMEHLVLSWAGELNLTRLKVNLFDPGPVASRLRANAFPGENRDALPAPAHVAPALAALCLPAETRSGALVRFAAA
jgi:NAD(P)-dependent dehydrogenase (short-subunit alcohol dehydrogenase family)